MKDIKEYMLLPIETRQEHLRLDVQCIERGGPKDNGLSYLLKGLLAHHLDTTIPGERSALVCHACHNSNCANPQHLYWGTYGENARDKMNNGARTSWDAQVEKYGLDGAKERLREIANKAGAASKGGKARKGKKLSEEHKAKIAEGLRNSKRGPKNQTDPCPGG